ncbi:MAG: regulatory protein RecX [Bacillota bacterium]|jgi:regulatory protein
MAIKKDPPRAMDCALRVLSRRRVSTGQMESLLKRKGALESDINECIARLSEWGYLDDRRLAKDILHEALATCPIGRRRASYELLKRSFQKGISEDAVSEVFGELAEEDLAKEALSRKLRGRDLGSLKEKERVRLARWLWRRGFDGQSIRSALAGYGQDTLE